MPIAAFHTTSLSSNPVRAEIASAQLTLIDPGTDGAAPSVETLDWVLDPRWKNAPDIDAVLQSVAEEGPSPLTGASDQYVEGLHEINEAIFRAWKAGFVLVVFDAPAHLTIVENEPTHHYEREASRGQRGSVAGPRTGRAVSRHQPRPG